MQTATKVKLKYQTQYITGHYGSNEHGLDPKVFLNCLILNVNNIIDNTTITSYVQGKTGNPGGPGSIDYTLTPILLIRDGAADEFYDCEQHGSLLYVKNVKFKRVKTLTFIGTNDYFSDFEALPDNHIAYYSGNITLDLEYEIVEHAAGTYYKLRNVVYNNRTISSQYFDDDPVATGVSWHKTFGLNTSIMDAETSNDVGRFIRYASTTVEELGGDSLVFNYCDIGKCSVDGPQRCKSRNYSSNLSETTSIKDVEYVFDFTGTIDVDRPNASPSYTLISDLCYLGNTAPTELTGRYAELYASSAPEVVETHTYNEYLIEYTKQLYYEFYNSGRNDRPNFAFDRIQKFIEDISHQDVDLYSEDLIDSIIKAYDSTIPFSSCTCTPMEYYSGHTDSSIVVFNDRLSNVTKTIDLSEVPTYFWVETLKNWCYYTIEPADNECNIAMLNVWNGKDGWYRIDSIIDTVKKNYLTKEQILELENTVQHSVSAADKLAAKNRLNAFIKAYTGLMLLYPFRVDLLNTVDIERVYRPLDVPDYEGHTTSHWYDPFTSLVRDIKNDFVDYWDGLFTIITSPAYLFFFEESMGDRLIKGWKTLGSGVLGLLIDGWKIATGLEGGLLVQELYIFFFQNSPSTQFAKIDHLSTLYADCRYIDIQYDSHFSSNDKITYQTIREPNRFVATGGIYNRSSLLPYIVIPTPVGSPFVFRDSAGSLKLAYVFSYSGPIREFYDGGDDFKKYPGIIDRDAELTNTMLKEQFGSGEDKTAEDWLNLLGNVSDLRAQGETVTLIESKLTNEQVALTTSYQKAQGSMTMKANRSKTTSDTDTQTINTLTKW